MQLLYKDDWPRTRERFEAWWAGEYFGRCALAVTAPRAGAPAEPEPPEPATPAEKWTNLDYRSALAEWRHRSTFYGGEAFPAWDYCYPGNKRLAAFMGCEVKLSLSTGWLEPVLRGEGIEYRGLKVDESGARWREAIDWLERGARESRGKCIPAVGAFGGCGDTLAALRGTDRLLLDLVDRPDEVRAADQFLMDAWMAVYGRFHAITREAAGGSTCWFSLWSPGKFYATQNDFAYMISPRMFRDIFLPTLEKQTTFLDHAVHHVDGIGNFAHVDALCELPRLQALQILPGAGKPGPLHYMDLLRRIQGAGKNLHISISASEVKDALENLSARGLFISTSCRSEDEARALLGRAERWSRDRRAAPAARK